MRTAWRLPDRFYNRHNDCVNIRYDFRWRRFDYGEWGIANYDRHNDYWHDCWYDNYEWYYCRYNHRQLIFFDRRRYDYQRSPGNTSGCWRNTHCIAREYQLYFQ